jgi:MFS family permease
MTTTTAERTATYREVFAVAEFRTVFVSYALYLIGETTRMLALSVLTYLATGSTLLAAVAYVAGFLPYVIGGAFFLAFVDRWSPRSMIVGYDLVRLVVTLILALDVIAPTAMIALVFVSGIASPLAGAARQSLLPELLDGDAYVLGRSVLTITSGAMQVGGMAAGGAVLALAGPHALLWLASATCLVSALLVSAGLRDRPARSRPIGAPVARTWTVNRQLLRDPTIRGLLLAQWLPTALFVGAEGVLVPYAAGLGAADAAGTLFAAAAGGMLVGDLVVGRLVAPSRRERLSPWFALLLAPPLLLFPLRPGVPVAAVLLGVATFGFAYQLGLQRRFVAVVPVEVRGQAFGLVSTGLMSLQGLAMTAAGGLAELVSPGTVVAIAGAASLTGTLTLWKHLKP